MVKDPVLAELKASVLRVRDGIILAGIGTLVSFPHIYDQAYSLYPRLFTQPASPEKIKAFILGETILYFFALLIFVLIGNLANRRVGLKPFKSPGAKEIIYALGLGIVFIPVSYILYDHLVLALVPESYARKWFFALAYPVSFSLPQELFNRFGLLSLVVWISGKTRRQRILASILTAILLAGLGYHDFLRLVDTQLKPTETIFLIAGTFIMQWIGNELYLKNGFFPALAFRFGLSLKFPVYFLLFFN